MGCLCMNEISSPFRHPIATSGLVGAVTLRMRHDVEGAYRCVVSRSLTPQRHFQHTISGLISSFVVPSPEMHVGLPISTASSSPVNWVEAQIIYKAVTFFREQWLSEFQFKRRANSRTTGYADCVILEYDVICVFKTVDPVANQR